MKLSLVPAGPIRKDLLELLKTHLESCGFTVTISEEIPLPHKAYNPQRDQYLAQPFLDREEKGHHLIITDVDLYTPGLNFIFGYGPGPNAIISIARLKGPLLPERMIKEAVHELGHVFSANHCPDPRCVMHFSNSLADTDYKSKEFCPRCRNQLQKQFNLFS